MAIARPGEAVDPTRARRTITQVMVSPAYFRSMGIALQQGRDFDARDGDGSLPVAIVNAALAARVWGSEPATGRQLELGPSRSPVTVIGVVADARHRELVGEAEPIVYRPFSQVAWRHARLVVRANGDPRGLVDAVQAAVWRADALLPLTEVRTLDDVVIDFLLPQRAMSISMANMGLTGLLVTAIGLYGLLAVIVAQRRREIGIRMALGAVPSNVVRGIVARTLKMTGIGLACGLALAFVLTKSLAAVLPGARIADPLSLGGTLLVLALVATAASFVPARRATRIDPLIVLRS